MKILYSGKPFNFSIFDLENPVMERTVKIVPSAPLRPYISTFVIDEKGNEGSYKILPGTALVVGFQYKGRLSVISNRLTTTLTTAGITGLFDTYKIFKNSTNIGSILVHFSATGARAFFDTPTHELYNGSYSLEELIDKSCVREIEEKLSEANDDNQRISLVEQFFLSRLQNTEPDEMVLEAVRVIKNARGNIRMLQLADELNISTSQMEKRFRAMVGASPKKFASIVRFNAVLNGYQKGKDWCDLAFLAGYFDQAHFIKSFKSFTGLTPEQYFHNPLLRQ
jgi:AraC-like DNA-binding protein